MMRPSPFFDGVAQVDLKLDEHDVKLPIFYFDGKAMTSLYPAKLSKLRKLLPDPRFRPARLLPGVGVVAITCFEYIDTDIGPYNELAIAIPLNVPYFRSNLPGRALLEAQLSGQFHAWVQHLPVTTEIALVAGKRLWNYPKFVADIDYTESGGTRTCRLAENGEHILTITRDPMQARGPADNQIFSHLWHERQPQSSEFKLHAGAAAQSPKFGSSRIELGSTHAIARELSDVLLSKQSLGTQWSERMEGILYGPEHMMLPLIENVMGGTHPELVG